MPDTTISVNGEVELDAEGRRLQLEAEKAKYVETIAKSQQAAVQARTPSLTSLLPTSAGAPKGEVTVGDKAGALGPWRAHQVVDAVAYQIATAVTAKLTKPREDGLTRRVLIVDERSLLKDDWTARLVSTTLKRLQKRVEDLSSGVEKAKHHLDNGIEKYQAMEKKEQEPQEQDRGQGGEEEEWRNESALSPAAPETRTTPAGAAPVGVTGALGGAVDLFSLLKTDYTLTASAVSAAPTELATLTAARLAATGVQVEADAFSTLPQSPSAEAFAAILSARDAVVERLSQLQRVLAPVETELAAIKTRGDIVEKEWAAAAADAKGGKTTQDLRVAGDRLAAQAQRREQAAGPARTFVAYAVTVIADVDMGLATLLQVPDGGEAPLFTAARRERLDATTTASSPITEVLYVNLDALSADTVTRRSILGASGVVRFLSSGNASWLLLDAKKGTVATGGHAHAADLMTLGLENGTAQYAATPKLPASGGEIKDPLKGLEVVARVLLAVLAVILLVVGIASTVVVIRLAFT